MMDPADTVTQPIDLPVPLGAAHQRALALLHQAFKDLGGCTAVARRLIKTDKSLSYVPGAYNRSYVSQVIHGHLPPERVPPAFIDSILTAFGNGRIDCPHLKTDIAKGQCQTHAALTWGQVANTGYERLDQWRACQDCLQNPANQTKAQP